MMACECCSSIDPSLFRHLRQAVGYLELSRMVRDDDLRWKMRIRAMSVLRGYSEDSGEAGRLYDVAVSIVLSYKCAGLEGNE